MCFIIYARGGHLCHVTLIPLTNICPLGPWITNMQYGYDQPRGFEAENVWKKSHIQSPKRNKTWFLAHLSQRLIGELIGYPWSVVRRRRPSTISNVFSYETAWPIKAKFYMEPPWEGGTKVYMNGPGH